LRPVHSDRGGLAGSSVVSNSCDLNVERDFVVWIATGAGALIGTVLRAVHVSDVGDRLVDRFEVLVDVGLHPAAAQFNDGDDASACKACGPVVGTAKVRDVPGRWGMGPS
jgi:hypothetical protein